MSSAPLQRVDRSATLAPLVEPMRLDQAVAALFPEFSRSRLQGWIREGALRVDGAAAKPRQAVFGGERINLNAELPPVDHHEAQALPLSVVYEDAHMLVIDKPVGLVVHPGAGNPDATLLNALLAHHADAALLPRAGIVHRLDKDTSGLLVVAKTLSAHAQLVAGLQERNVHRHYLALVYGRLERGGLVDRPLGRHPRDRLRMAVREDGKQARTHYRPVEEFVAHTLVEVGLDTGRTHQIRVHLGSLGYPLIGDPLYGGHFRQPPRGHQDNEVYQALLARLRSFDRQALHAWRLQLLHPHTGQALQFEAPLPVDMQALLDDLRLDAAAGAAFG